MARDTRGGFVSGRDPLLEYSDPPVDMEVVMSNDFIGDDTEALVTDAELVVT
jgi:hypothetical protein